MKLHAFFFHHLLVVHHPPFVMHRQFVVHAVMHAGAFVHAAFLRYRLVLSNGWRGDRDRSQSRQCSPKPISEGQSLRFTLVDDSDFEKFKKALTTELSGIVFYGGVEEGDDAEGKREELARQM
jgi:hypothetical protein